MERNSSGIVKLNVGGVRVMTTMSTLKSRGPNFLSTMLESDASGKLPTMRDSEGYAFIDRNGSAFTAVLDYMRTGELIIPEGMSRRQVEAEFDFYQIQIPGDNTNKALSAGQLLKEQQERFGTFVMDFLVRHWLGIFEQLRAKSSRGNDLQLVFKIQKPQSLTTTVVDGRYDYPGGSETQIHFAQFPFVELLANTIHTMYGFDTSVTVYSDSRSPGYSISIAVPWKLRSKIIVRPAQPK